jgi:K+-transporting ATPase ATPase A chain
MKLWIIPIGLLALATLCAIPLSAYFSWIMEGKFRPPRWLRWFEESLDTGEQTWKGYAVSLIVFNAGLFVAGFLVLALQPWMPMNQDHKGMLAPTTIFNAVVSFMTNTNLQHYAGDVNLSNFSQIFFCILNMFLSASVGFCALVAIIRAFRGQKTVGNFFVDMWRVFVYLFMPVSIIFAVFFVSQGSPMSYESSFQVSTLEPGSMGTNDKGEPAKQTIVTGPVAALESIKMLGTNGGGFFGMNAAHPYENPTAASNFFNTLEMMLFPFSLVLMYGRMLGRMRHSWVIFSVMLLMMAGTIIWSVYFDTMKPNPAFTPHPASKTYEIAGKTGPKDKITMTLPRVAPLPVDQHLGNLEGKELRFGTSAGATYAAVTTDVTCGSVNAEGDALNPLAALAPMTGMWLNCIFGGKGVGLMNFLMFLILGIFLAGQMVGRTPEYLGKKIGGREVKLAVIALLMHPIMILLPVGFFAATPWGIKAETNPGPHGFSQITYQFSSASANNGSAFDGLNVSYGFSDNPNPAPEARAWDIATGLVMLFGRYLPIIAMIAMAGFLGEKKSAPFGLGTLRDDTVTFGFLLLGTVIVVGALLFLPLAALGPIAEHLGPMPFGG